MNSVDFSEGIRLIRDAHNDATAILEKWRELIDAPGVVTLQVKDPNGEIHTVELPSIREAISRYLGGVFAKITLSDGTHSVTLQLDENGKVILLNDDMSPADLIAGKVVATSIVPKDGTGIAILGTTTLFGGIIANATAQSINAYGARIYNSEFQGTTQITGGATVYGTARMHNITADSLNIGTIVYRKQTLKWKTEAIVDDQLNASTSGGLWTGDPAILERAGIYATPTWNDCISAPNPLTDSGATLQVFYGTPEDGAIPIRNGESLDFPAPFAAMWPYKMYEPVNGGYRIRWLPLNDNLGRITYFKTGETAPAPGQLRPILYTAFNIAHAMGSYSASTAVAYTPQDYACRRFIADVESISYGTSEVTIHRIFPT